MLNIFPCLWHLPIAKPNLRRGNYQIRSLQRTNHLLAAGRKSVANASVTIKPHTIDTPQEILDDLRQRAERYYNVVHYNQYPEGDLFAIHERAAEMTDDLRTFFRPLRTTI